jgi:ABC-2 type transport system ATP-binding protein
MVAFYHRESALSVTGAQRCRQPRGFRASGWPSTYDPPVIDAHDLTRDYGTLRALDGVSVSVQPGEILGFLGPNGAGKSTTVKILTGMIAPTSGTATVAGFDVVAQPIEVKRRIGFVPESGVLYETLSPDEYLELVGCLHHLDARTRRARADELLDVFGLTEVRDKRLFELSKGMKQKVVIAASLLHKPDVLFLDEPLDGLDANTAMLVKELLKQLAAQGRTILFCSHILDVVERICTRIVIIDKGRKIAEGTAAELRTQTGAPSLELAFNALTGGAEAGAVTAEFLAALERV